MDRTRMRRHPRARGLDLVALVISRGNRSSVCTVENLSAGGALLVTDCELAVGDALKLVIECGAERFTLSAQAYRIEARTDMPRTVAIAFRDVPPNVADQLGTFVEREVERHRARSPEMVMLLGLPPHERANLERDLTSLRRYTMVATHPLEATWYLQDRGYRIHTVIVDLDPDTAAASELLAHVSEEYPSVRTVALSSRAHALGESRGAGRHALLRRPWNQDDLLRALATAGSASQRS